ncbi:MAG: hypothetical protein NT001_06275 [Candidatus Woesearchaeota archaeon]|nr:hypothetical protein [Candidatus Woesearchaeota archaeon]
MKDKTPTLLDLFDQTFVNKFMERRRYGNPIEDGNGVFGFILSPEETVLRYHKQKNGCYTPDGNPVKVPDIETFGASIQEYFEAIFPSVYDEKAEDFYGLETDKELFTKEMASDLRQGFVDVQGKQRAYQADASFMPSGLLMMFDGYNRPFFSNGVIPQVREEGGASICAFTVDDLEFLSSNPPCISDSPNGINDRVITQISHNCAFVLPKPKEPQNNYQP